MRQKEKSKEKMQRSWEKGRRDKKWEGRSHISKTGTGFQTVACSLRPSALQSRLQKGSQCAIQQCTQKFWPAEPALLLQKGGGQQA